MNSTFPLKFSAEQKVDTQSELQRYIENPLNRAVLQETLTLVQTNTVKQDGVSRRFEVTLNDILYCLNE
jgi:hypothetical protein